MVNICPGWQVLFVSSQSEKTMTVLHCLLWRFPQMMKCLDWPLRGPSLTTSQKLGPKSREVEHLGQKQCSVVDLRFEGFSASWPQKTRIMRHYINLMLKLNFSPCSKRKQNKKDMRGQTFREIPLLRWIRESFMEGTRKPFSAKIV